MGGVKRILASKKIEAAPNKFIGIELCETIHFHMPGFRFEQTAQEFGIFADIVRKAYIKWFELGKPATAEFTPLAGNYTPDETVYPTRFEVEEQGVPEVNGIHIHIRGLSLRQSISDFKAFASVIEEADKKLE